MKVSINTYYQEKLSGTEYLGRPDNRKISGPGQGQGQDHLLLQRAALPHYLVLALTLTLVLSFFNHRVVPDIPSLITSLDLLIFLTE